MAEAAGSVKTEKRRLLAWGALALAALVFGATFVIVKRALEELPPYAFLTWRFLLATACLLPLSWPRSRATWWAGVVAGVVLFAGYALQTVGLRLTSASHSGLITGLYVIFTPLMAAAVGRRLPTPLVVVGSLLAFGGLALLTLPLEPGSGAGDLLTVACAAAFAAHVVILARLAPRHGPVAFTAVQLAVVAVLSLGASAATEGLPLPGKGVLVALALTGVGATAGAFLLQVWAQTIVGPSQTVLILALEPAFAAVLAAAMLGERLSGLALAGAVLILIGIQLVLRHEHEELPPVEARAPPH